MSHGKEAVSKDKKGAQFARTGKLDKSIEGKGSHFASLAIFMLEGGDVLGSGEVEIFRALPKTVSSGPFY